MYSVYLLVTYKKIFCSPESFGNMIFFNKNIIPFSGTLTFSKIGLNIFRISSDNCDASLKSL